MFFSLSLCLCLCLSLAIVSVGAFVFARLFGLWTRFFFFFFIGDRGVSGGEKGIGGKNGRSCYLFFFFNLEA